MNVYRIVGAKELEYLINGQIDKLGREFLNSDINSHHYKEGHKYIHFFINKKACKHMLPVNFNLSTARDCEKRYICTFNIPLKKLLTSFGVGHYYSFENCRGYDPVIVNRFEFALDIEKYNPSWLVACDEIKSQSDSDEMNL